MTKVIKIRELTSNTLIRLSTSISPNMKASAKPMSEVKQMRSQNVGFKTVIEALTPGEVLLWRSSIEGSGKT